METTMKHIPIIKQHVDRDITKKDFLDFGDTILVTSMFRTIQGEGPLAGRPAVFVRLSGCNYGSKSTHCEFCDSNFLFDKGTPYTIHHLADELRELRGDHYNDVLVITGGEPTLQRNLIGLIQELEHGEFSEIQIETNGTQGWWFKELASALEGSHKDFDLTYLPMIVISPKGNYSTQKEAKIPDSALEMAQSLKFVVDSDVNSVHHEIPEWAFKFRNNYNRHVYVSPMTLYLRPYIGEVASAWDQTLIDVKRTAENYSYASQYAMDNDLVLSIQSHLFLNKA